MGLVKTSRDTSENNKRKQEVRREESEISGRWKYWEGNHCRKNWEGEVRIQPKKATISEGR